MKRNFWHLVNGLRERTRSVGPDHLVAGTQSKDDFGYGAAQRNDSRSVDRFRRGRAGVYGTP